MNSLVKCISLLLLAGIIGCESNSEDSSSTIGQKSEFENSTFVHNRDAEDFQDDWSKENVVVYHVIGEPNDMHPTNGASGNRTFVHLLTQGFLMNGDLVDLSGVIPSLIVGPPSVSEDQLRYTYELREEPTWDDGSQLTVEDVVFTLKAVRCPLTDNPHHKPFIEMIKAIEQDSVNSRKFTLVMKQQYIHNVAILTEFPIMQEAYWDSGFVLRNYLFQEFDDPDFDENESMLLNWAKEFNDPKYGRTPEFLVGIGAYEFSDWKVGQNFTLTRKTDHWTSKLHAPTIYEQAYPEKIIFKLNTDENSQILEFKTQILDGSNALSSSALNQLKDSESFNRNYHSAITPSFNYSYMAFNMRPDGIVHRKLFVDLEVRKAVAYLVPYDQLNQVLFEGSRERRAGPVSSRKPSFNSNLKLVPYDLEKAKQILKEEGWTDSDNDNILDKEIEGQKEKFEFDLYYMTNSTGWKDMAVMISESLYEAGIKCNPVPMEFTVLSEKSRNHDFDAMLKVWGGSSSPEDFTQVWHTDSWAKKGLNYVGFGNAETDALIDSIKCSTSAEKRKPLEDRFQQKVVDQQPYVFLFASSRTNVIHKRFGNADMYLERPGVLLNNLRLLQPGVTDIASD